MKKMRIRSFFLVMVLCVCGVASAQDVQNMNLDATTNGQTSTNENGMIYLQPWMETNGSGLYREFDDNGNRIDYTFSFSPQCVAPDVPLITFARFDLAGGDSVIVYDGPSTSSPRLASLSSTSNGLQNVRIYGTASNSSGILTLRFKPNGDGVAGIGFLAYSGCGFPCEMVTPVIENKYYKTLNGVIIDTGYLRNFMLYDTLYAEDDSTVIRSIDSMEFRGVHLCYGEGVILNGHGEYTSDFGYYTPRDMTSTFKWNFGNGDTLVMLNARQGAAYYKDLDCYDVTLNIIDEQGCSSRVVESVRVRLAQNPIKTIYDLDIICNKDSLMLNVGYEGQNGTLTMKRLEFSKTVSKVIECLTFLPDGSDCPASGDFEVVEGCFRAPILYDQFPAGRTVTSKDDICSICVNMEHSFMGDYSLSVVCPSGQKSALKYKEQNEADDPANVPVGAYGGGGKFTGYAFDMSRDGYSSDDITNYCVANANPPGGGLDYCFSRNGEYILIDGTPADNPVDGDHYLANDNYMITETYDFGTIPPPYNQAGWVVGAVELSTKHPSDHEHKLDYYKPATDFSSLVGCPLNGSWEIEVCDKWKIDNGWIFEWALDICGISSGVGCEYQVGIDSAHWVPDTSYADFDLGFYRGAVIRKQNDFVDWISTPDTAGRFGINVHIWDEFGCRWDTNTRITSVWNPQPSLGNDTLLCDVETFYLDASDIRAPKQNYTYTWAPFGETDSLIETHPSVGSSTLYTVEVTNTVDNKRCSWRDSIRVNVNQQPAPNFDPGIYPLEGCEPFTINIKNTSKGGDRHLWVFGDGDSSVLSDPSHTYGAGVYGFKYYIETDAGCRDSLVYDTLITVYSSPEARFAWSPVNPTVMHPQVQFENRTIPQSSRNKYYWEVQYDRDNPISYHTLTDVNPSFEWENEGGQDISGTYIARLIAKTSTLAPSGNIVECRDTIENKILLVNDFLQFPNVVTPNGDGINDKFVILNLIEGLGYPINSLAIYNRWGKRIFFKENISKEEDFWDPAADNIPSGTYFWRFSGKGYLGNIERNGTVEVIYP